MEELLLLVMAGVSTELVKILPLFGSTLVTTEYRTGMWGLAHGQLPMGKPPSEHKKLIVPRGRD